MEEDVAVLTPTIRHLTERQHQLFFLFHTLIARFTPDGFARVVDADVAEAAAALASTLETAARGVIYEHVPQSLVAQRLSSEMKTMLAQMREQGATVSDSEVAIALRAIEHGARETQGRAAGGDGAYLELMARLLQVNRAAAARSSSTNPPASSLILP